MNAALASISPQEHREAGDGEKGDSHTRAKRARPIVQLDVVMAWVDSSGGSLTPCTVFGAGLVLGFFAISILIDARPKAAKT